MRIQYWDYMMHQIRMLEQLLALSIILYVAQISLHLMFHSKHALKLELQHCPQVLMLMRLHIRCGRI